MRFQCTTRLSCLLLVLFLQWGCEEPTNIHPDFLQGIELGTNTPGASGADAFVPLENGDPLQVVLGFQGLYMIVLAARVPDVSGIPVKVYTTLELDGVLRNDSRYSKAFPLEAGGDGYQYFFDIWMIVEDHDDYLGELCTLYVELYTPDEKFVGTQSIDLVLMPPDIP